MPYRINWKTKGVAWTFHGTLTGQEAIQANKDIYGDPRFDDLRYQVVDISKVERFDIPDEDMEATAAMDEAATITSPRLAVAVIATEEEAVAVAESYKSAMSETTWEVEVFNCLEDAAEWIRDSCELTREEMEEISSNGRPRKETPLP